MDSYHDSYQWTHGFLSGFVAKIRIMDSYHGFVSVGSWIGIMDSYPGFVSWIRIMDSYHRNRGVVSGDSYRGFVSVDSWIRIKIRIPDSHHELVSWIPISVFMDSCQDSYPAFVPWIRVMGSYRRIHGFVPGFVYKIRIQESYHGFVSWIRSGAFMDSYQDSYPGIVGTIGGRSQTISIKNETTIRGPLRRHKL